MKTTQGSTRGSLRTSATANLLTESGPQFISAKVFGDPDCASGASLGQLRIVVTEVG